jgi:acyl dehydratase
MSVSAITSVATVHDLVPLVGQSLGTSEPFTLDQQTINAFARLTRDEQWIHTDPERAAAGPFGTTIAHGYLTLSLLPHLVESIVEVRDASMAVNYGLNKVRFPSPAPAGSQVRASVTLRSLEEVGSAIEVVMEVVVTPDGSERPCCVAEAVTRVYS